jgi:hypothetical protein
MQPELQRAWADFEKSRSDLQRDIPGFVDVIDKHEALVRLRLDQMEQNLLRKNIWTDLAAAIPNRAKKAVRENYGWLLVALAVAIYFGFSESRESCIKSASKRPTDAGARIAYGECDKRFPNQVKQ